MSYSIRLMKESDMDRVLTIENDLFSIPWTREAFNNEINNELAFVLEVDGELVGYICSLLVLDEAEISNVAVSKIKQKCGYGKILLNEMIMILKEKGCKRIFLEVRQSNIPAKRLYQGYGFSLLGYRKGYYRNPKEDALILKFEI